MTSYINRTQTRTQDLNKTNPTKNGPQRKTETQKE